MVIATIFISQLLFTISDITARFYMGKYGFRLESFLSVWFIIYILIRSIATFGQLYAFSNFELGKTMAYFGAASIVLSNLIGLLLFKEILSPTAYIGVSLAFISILLLAYK